jgi:hypothetical protein
MTGFVKKDVIDGIATALLALGCSNKLNAPTWIIREMLTRKTDPVKAARIFGVRNARLRPSLVDEYLEKKGYQYTWGAVSEHVTSFEDGDDGEEEIIVGKFEFYPEEILKEFPNAAMLQDLMMWMYGHHPLKDANYPAEIGLCWHLRRKEPRQSPIYGIMSRKSLFRKYGRTCFLME